MILKRPSLQNLAGKKELIGAEIGVFKGYNAKEILKKLDIKKIYLIDLNLTMARRYLQGFENKIIWIEGKSQEVAKKIPDGSLDFAYIDGGHKKLQVTMDLHAYYPKVKPGGLICGHDYMKEKKLGVVEAVNEFFEDREIFSGKCPGTKRHLDWWVWKDEKEN